LINQLGDQVKRLTDSRDETIEKLTKASKEI